MFCFPNFSKVKNKNTELKKSKRKVINRMTESKARTHQKDG